METNLREKVWDFISQNEDEIIRKAVENACDIASTTVWLDLEDMSLSIGTYTQGTFENPENVRNSIAVLSLDPIDQSPGDFDIPDDDLCITRDDDGIAYRNSNHPEYVNTGKEFDPKNRLSDEEERENLFEAVEENLFDYMRGEEYERGIDEQIEELIDQYKMNMNNNEKIPLKKGEEV